jgi:regulator of extracellular matrix RemA (YlzA/DUF370 family)
MYTDNRKWRIVAKGVKKVYLHLGNDQVISGERVIAIINLEEPTKEEIKVVIENAELDRRLTIISKNEKRKALVICDDQIYVSPISSNTLYKRAIQIQKEGII